MSTSIVLTVVSDDHPGIVEAVSDVIAGHGGNWTESSMMSLAGKFAGILLAHLPAARADDFLSALVALESQGIQVVAQRCDSESEMESARDYSLELVGQDHPGIVHDITEVLARHGVNVQEL
jgi:glycine cleavage system regulatory protein